MKLLILSANYPNLKGELPMPWVRTRNLYYKQQGENVEVLSFEAPSDYEIDGIKVWTKNSFIKNGNIQSYDLVICHAANLRHHYLFLRKYASKIKKIVFFYHGHEVLKINKVYSKPYPYMKANFLKRRLQDLYDDTKLFLWRKFIEKNYKKCGFIFVSKWMKNEFIKWVKLNNNLLLDRSFITYNSVGEIFEKNNYDTSSPKEYDFVTIRRTFDVSKYAVDIINQLAFNNPTKKFLLYGKGNFFKYYQKAPNLTWINGILQPKEIPDVLNKAKCALMPTRTDAQGVMMCEMATFGMPLITSDIPVCHEVFENFSGIAYIDNNNVENVNLDFIYNAIVSSVKKNDQYFYSKVMKKELEELKYIHQLQ